MRTKKMKPTPQQQMAFLIETIAHLSDNQTIRAHCKELLVAAQIVRHATNEQLVDAMRFAEV